MPVDKAARMKEIRPTRPEAMIGAGKKD